MNLQIEARRLVTINLVFGSQCDGQVWPETPGGTALSVGSAVVGPKGLLAAVENVLGTRQPPVAAVTRIAAMRAKLAAVQGDRFWSRSFKADPWSTARLILEWRDDLVAGGWGHANHPSLSPRLRDMVAAEAAQPKIPDGLADRCMAAALALKNGRFSLPWTTVTLVDPRELLVPHMRTLVEAIGAAGIDLADRPEPTIAAGDLGKLQRLIAGGVPEPLSGDGTVLVMHADTEAMAADALAGWLAAGDPCDREDKLFVLGTSTGMLDAALAERSLPKFGHSPTSPARAALQVLRLAFATRWAPFDPSALMELMLVPEGPIPWSVVNILTKTLAEVPGRGSAFWMNALAECEAARRAYLATKASGDEDIDKVLARDTARWREWVVTNAHDPKDGIPAPEVIRTCGMVASWAAGTSERDPLRLRALGIANDLAAAVVQFGGAKIPRNLLSRMMDEAIGPGMADPAAVAEAAPWSAVHFPGAVWSSASTVIWWAPAGAVTPKAGSWTTAEVEALAQCGCQLHAGSSALALAARSWRQPILNATERVVLVLSKTVDGSKADEHPLMHEIAPLLKGAAAGVVFQAEELLRGEIEVHGLTGPRTPIVVQTLETPVRRWTVPTGSIPLPHRASATSIELMLGCRFAYALQHAARLRPGSRAAVPAGERLLGLLAHAVLREVFLPGAPPDPTTAKQMALEVLERVLETEAAPLLLPGNAVDLVRARSRIPTAVAHLADGLAAAGLRVIGTELTVSVSANHSPLAGFEMEGRLDLVAERGDGARVVIDAKWTKDIKYRRAELEKGRAVQLATYRRLQPQGVPATAAYFMLSQSRVLAADLWPFEDRRIRGPVNLDQTWDEAAKGWAASVAEMRGGELDATGITRDAIQHPSAIQIDPPCTFCNYTGLCGKVEAA